MQGAGLLGSGFVVQGSLTGWLGAHRCDVHTRDLGGQLHVSSHHHTALSYLQVDQVALACRNHHLETAKAGKATTRRLIEGIEGC